MFYLSKNRLIERITLEYIEFINIFKEIKDERVLPKY